MPVPLKKFRSLRAVTGVTPNACGYTDSAAAGELWPAGAVIIPRAVQSEAGGSMAAFTDGTIRSQLVNTRGGSLQAVDYDLDRSKVTPEISKRALAMAEAQAQSLLQAGKIDATEFVQARAELGLKLTAKLVKEAGDNSTSTRLMPADAGVRKHAAVSITDKNVTGKIQALTAGIRPAPANNAQAVSDLLAGFAIPGLEPTATKPLNNVSFDFGPIGKQGARYHWLAMGENGLELYLIYDRRYDGEPYVLPRLENKQTVRVRTPDNEVDVAVYSIGLCLEFGTFHVQCLLVAENYKVLPEEEQLLFKEEEAIIEPVSGELEADFQ